MEDAGPSWVWGIEGLRALRPEWISRSGLKSIAATTGLGADDVIVVPDDIIVVPDDPDPNTKRDTRHETVDLGCLSRHKYQAPMLRSFQISSSISHLHHLWLSLSFYLILYRHGA